APTITPTPTPAPTPTPVPTPAPTPDPAELEKLEKVEKASSQLPMYIGLAALVGCGAVLAGVLLKRRADENKKNQRRRSGETRRR
ncbi:MAG: hypothetical protein PHO10_12165, partial [Gemmiger sp.]|nr:hypothetical protein [Gemmiger sp.]